MKSFFKSLVISSTILSFEVSSKVLIKYEKELEAEREKVRGIIVDKINIPQNMIDEKVASECEEDDKYDLVICLNKKNGGELKFPTVKSFLIKNKYEFFKKN